jgi:hypothetical protein
VKIYGAVVPTLEVAVFGERAVPQGVRRSPPSVFEFEIGLRKPIPVGITTIGEKFTVAGLDTRRRRIGSGGCRWG